MLLLLTLVAIVGCSRPAGPVQRLSSQHWMRPTKKAVISSPVAYDWTGDGRKEIAVGSWDGHFYLMDADLVVLPGWPKYSPQGFFASPALGDLDGDGSPEIIIADDRGQLHAWHADGREAEGFPVSLGYRNWASAAVLADGSIAIGGLERTLLLDRQGRHVQGWPQAMPHWADATVAIGPDVIAVTTLLVGTKTKGALCAWHMNGTPYDWSPIPLAMDSDSSPALADLDGDGSVEIIVGDDEGYLHVIGLDGQPLAGFPQRANSLIEASPAIADLDGDGMLDIAVGSWDGRMYVWDHRGKALPGWPVQVGDQIISSAALADLDGDDVVDIVVGSKDHHLYAWRSDGTPLPGYPFDLGDAVHSSPWVGDLEGDGRADVVVGANNGIHVIRDVGSMGRAPWPMFHRDERNTGAIP